MNEFLGRLNIPGQIKALLQLPSTLRDTEERLGTQRDALRGEQSRLQEMVTAPAPQPRTLGEFVGPKMEAVVTPEPRQSAAASSPDRIREIFASQLGSQNPARNDLNGYFPVLNYLDQFMQKEQEYKRPGLATLLALQSLLESTGGRANNGNNLFGALPPGGIRFQTPQESIDYQLGPNMLGGGATPAMNILDTEGPITPDDIRDLYVSYDPPGAYLNNMLRFYGDAMGY